MYLHFILTFYLMLATSSMTWFFLDCDPDMISCATQTNIPTNLLPCVVKNTHVFFSSISFALTGAAQDFTYCHVSMITCIKRE